MILGTLLLLWKCGELLTISRSVRGILISDSDIVENLLKNG